MSRPENGVGRDRRDFVQSLERGLAVIQAFSRERPTLGLSDVARITGLSRPTARRVLLTLERLGYVRSDGRRFVLTPRVLSIGYAYLSSLSLPEIAGPYMEELVEQTHESCSVTILDGTDVVYVARIPAKRTFNVALGVGSRLPAFVTSSGRVLLAHLPPAQLDEYFRRASLRALTHRTLTREHELREVLAAVRASGWVLVDQELEEGMRSVAAPLRDASGQVIAAIALSSHAGWVSLSTVQDEFLPLVRQTAARISDALRHKSVTAPISNPIGLLPGIPACT